MTAFQTGCKIKTDQNDAKTSLADWETAHKPPCFMLVNGRCHMSSKWVRCLVFLTYLQLLDTCSPYRINLLLANVNKLIGVLVVKIKITESWFCSWKSVLFVQSLMYPCLISSADNNSDICRFNTSAQMSRSERSGRRWRTSLVSVLCHYRPRLRLCFYNESALFCSFLLGLQELASLENGLNYSQLERLNEGCLTLLPGSRLVETSQTS